MHVETNNLLRNSQHGFRTGKSVQTNLVEFLDAAMKWMDVGTPFDVLYLDFSKAFNKVDHKRLMVKLESVGIKGKLKEWLQDWLKGRRQRVKVEGCLSEWREVESGVIQGSVLGGILFNIFIDDLDDAATLTLILKFADDTKMAKEIRSKEDAQHFQRAIDAISRWAKKWEMEFNIKKCKILHFGKKNPQYEYTMDGEILATAEEEKDLGVWISTSLKPSKQCEMAAKAANFTLGQIRRSFHYRRKEHLIPLFQTFVRPKLEFGVAAWNPWLEADIRTLEKVQERAVKMVSNKSGSTYEERLKSVGMTTLKARRERGDAIETYKTLRGFNRVDKNEWFEISGPESRATRRTTSITDDGEERKPDSLYKPSFNLEVRKNFFTVRAVDRWNELPESVKRAQSINGFKDGYDRWKRETEARTLSIRSE